MIKPFVINLAKNTNRLESMCRQLSHFGLEFERIDAVLGVGLSLAEMRRDFCCIRSFFAMMRRLRVGEIGCALSHLSVYRKMIERQMQYALVLEDDITLCESFKEILKVALANLNADKPMVILLSALSTSDTFNVPGLQRIKKGWGADAYLITLPAAKAILHSNYPVVIPADQWGTWASREKIELYRMWPTAVWQDRVAYTSEIAASIRPWPLLFSPVYKMLRLMGLIVDELWFKVTGR